MRRQDTDFPVAELTDRYQIVRSQVYARINALKGLNPDLAPFKIGVKAYVNQAVLGCLDAMHRLITDEGLITEEAAAHVAAQIQTSITPDTQQTVSAIQKNELSGDEAPHLRSIREATESEPFGRYQWLDRVAERGWLLPSSELATLLGCNSVPTKDFERFGYRFTKSGKSGSENTWKTEKV